MRLPVEAFERRVDGDPGHAAVRGAAGDVSYGELDGWANAIAAELLARGGEAPVAVAVRSPAHLLAAELGALKAGRGFAAVNPLFPAPRIAMILEDLGAPELIGDRTGGAGLGRPALIVEDVIAARAGARRPGLAAAGDALAYVLFTSGSTGRPKGFAHDARAMADNIARHAPLGVGPDDCVALISADGFVAAVSCPYLALLGGATLAPYSFRDDGVEHALDWLADHRVTVFYGFPAFLRQVAAACDGQYAGVRLVYLGGDRVLPSDLAAARRLFPRATLATGLNSSETGLSCLHLVPPGGALPDRVPVGRPVDGVELVLGDGDEIELRSARIRPRLWRPGGAEDVTTALGDGRHAFRTGDRGRLDDDGVVFHLGRVDGMIKLRGVRVEAAEIEAAIAALPEVADVAVIAVGDDDDRALAAFVVARGAAEVSEREVRAAVARSLPASMIPATVTAIDALPRTANGKIDRKALAAVPRRIAAAEAASAAPGECDAARDVEARVLEILRGVLRVDRVTRDDDFFVLGGTSISALGVIARVRSELAAPVPLSVLFETPTAGALIDAVLRLRGV